MWRMQNGRSVARALVLSILWLAGSGHPPAPRSLSLSDEGPLYLYGWGLTARVQHLYAAGPYISNCYLRLQNDGTVDCVVDLNQRSLLEFRAVTLKTIVIKDVNSVRYLCMNSDGQMLGLDWYSEEDCTFREELDYLGFNRYKSLKHHLHIIMLKGKSRQQLENKLASNFLPVFPRSFLEIKDHLESKILPVPLKPDSMDPFGMEDLEVKSPSFQK